MRDEVKNDISFGLAVASEGRHATVSILQTGKPALRLTEAQASEVAGLSRLPSAGLPAGGAERTVATAPPQSPAYDARCLNPP